MIGDANGYTSRKVEVSLENPYTERFVKLLRSLKPIKGTWGIILNSITLGKQYLEGQISEDDLDFLLLTLFDEYSEEGSNYYIEGDEGDENNAFLFEFTEGVREEIECSFLVFKGIDLFYIDEFGVKFNTEIID